MYSAEIECGDLVFEGVQAALGAAQRVVALATPLSLASAWMDTEINNALDKPVTIAFDGSHPVLMELLQSWRPPRRSGERFFKNELLASLKEEYAHYNSKERLNKFEESATRFLEALRSFQVSVYPKRPATWAGHESILDFSEAIRGHPDDK
jgi:hypothetical protein